MSRRPTGSRQESDTPHYQTFPTRPPRSKGKPPPSAAALQRSNTANSSQRPNSASKQSSSQQHNASPLPKKQLFVLAIIALCEQTALNSISPYLPAMAATFPEVNSSDVGLYVGTIASVFALAQFVTNFFWGWCSDRIGRKPVILLGTLLTAACFVAFGFCRTLWQAIMVQVLMGIVNGNQGVVSTCLGEITDRSNQSSAFTYLPVVYGIGAITGPLVGGVLAPGENALLVTEEGTIKGHPYLAPNLLSAAVLLFDFVISVIFLEESLEQAKHLPPLSRRMGNMFTWLWQFTSSTRPSYMNPGKPKTSRHSPSNSQAVEDPEHSDIDEEEEDEEEEEEEDDDDDDDDVSDDSHHSAANQQHLRAKDVLRGDTLLILISYFIFQLSNIAYNSLYPIFGQGNPPTGRHLSPKEIGVLLSIAGVVTIIFQVGLFGRLRDKMGNKTAYRVSLAGFMLAFFLMPWVGYKDNAGLGVGSGKVWLWIELGIILIIKTVATVAGLTSALLLVTNSAPNHSVLGTLNGLAQTLSALGRAVGPFISGGLFSAATRIHPKGEAMPFGVFGGVAAIGFFISFGIKGVQLEAADWDEEQGDSGPDTDGEDAAEAANGQAVNGPRTEDERQPLLNGKK